MLRPRQTLGALGALTIVAAFSVGGPATAQDDLNAQFGSFKADAEAAGISLTYDAPGLIPPAGNRLFQVTIPQAQSLKDRTPSGSALASLVYPGPILTDLANVIRQASQQDVPIPPYPAMQRAFYPSDAQKKEQAVGGGTMTVETDETKSDAVARYGEAHLPGVLKIGAATSFTSTYVEAGQVVSRSRTELSNVDILAGLIHMEAITTDLVATSNGTESASDGSSEFTGVSFLGLPATIDGEGIHVGQPPSGTPPPSSSPLGPLLDPLGLGQLGEALLPVTTALNNLMTSVLGTTTGTVNQLLEAGGISIKVAEPDEVVNGAEASRRSNGFQLTIDYDGTKAPILSQLLALIPVDQLPNQGIPGVPLTDPQSIVLALKGQHIFGLGLAPASVHVVSKPPFSPKPKPTTTSRSAGTAGTAGRPGTPGTPSRQFTTPTPSLTTPTTTAGDDGLFDGVPILATANPMAVAGAVMALLAVGLLAWAFSGRLADNVLAPTAGGSCPHGRDHPPPGGGSP